MKKIILGLSLILINTLAHATNGLENIIVEKYYVSNAADAAGSSGNLPVGSVTYRIFADMLPGYNFQALYGVPGHDLVVQTSTSFFNNEDYGSTTPTISTTNIRKNTALLDSYFSVGGAANGRVGVLKSEDTNGSPGNAQGILQNNDPSTGGPINIGTTTSLSASDGMISGSPVDVTFVGITNAELNAFDATSQRGSSFSTSNGSIAALGGATGPTASNRVLIGQFTTDGVFYFEFNIQIGTPTGGVQNYVSHNPVGSEIQLPGLSNNFKLDIKLFVEGFYQGNGLMLSTLYDLFNNGFGTNDDPTATDTISVNLWYNHTDSLAAPGPGHSMRLVLHNNGTAGSILSTADVSGKSYYIAVKPKNAMETWSKTPVSFGGNSGNISYDFSTSLLKAFDDGANPPMKSLGAGRFGFYSGDINQDGGINGDDMNFIDNDNGGFGYNISDLNGDMGTNGDDMNFVDNNATLGLFFARPF
jgi:hypothetical protein